MMKRTHAQRWLAAILALTLILVLLPASALAANIIESSDYENYFWTFDDEGTLTIKWAEKENPYLFNDYHGYKFWTWIKADVIKVVVDGSMTTLEDSEFYGHEAKSVVLLDGVATIGDRAFERCQHLTDITIPDSVTHIGDSAFAFCTDLVSVTIPGSVANLGYGVFIDCSALESVTLSDGLSSIGDSTFAGCSRLASVTIPGSVTSIGELAFADCSRLESITIPDSMTSIGDFAFGDCRNLTDVYYGGSREQWEAISIGSNNYSLDYATIHYGNASASETPQPEPLPSWFANMPSQASTGTTTCTDKGETRTVYLYPAGTTFSLGNLDGYADVYNIATGELVAQAGYMTLPDSGIYRLDFLNVMWGPEGSCYISANGSAQPVAPTEQPSSWAASQVNTAIAAGFVPQSLQSKYTQATTRAEFCALAVGLYETVTGTQVTGRTTFTDTNDVNVEKAAYLGVVGGVGEGRFAPDSKLTRQQAAVMLAQLARVLGKPMAEQAPTFADNSAISSWAFDAVGKVQAAGVMGGVGNNAFSPASNYTREQSMITMLRMYELMG